MHDGCHLWLYMYRKEYSPNTSDVCQLVYQQETGKDVILQSKFHAKVNQMYTADDRQTDVINP